MIPPMRKATARAKASDLAVVGDGDRSDLIQDPILVWEERFSNVVRRVGSHQGGWVMLRLGLESSIGTVRDVQTYASEFVGFEPSDLAEDCARDMESSNFDFALVMTGGDVIGRVGADALRSCTGVVGDVVEPLSTRYMISADSPLRELFRWLAEDPWLLVIDGKNISGLVTPSDLNRPTTRTFFYIMIAAFEIRLSDAIRRTHTDQEALAPLSDDARDKIMGRLEAQTQSDFAADSIALMTLPELLKIAGKSDKVRGDFGIDSKSRWKDITGPIANFRNSIMHPTRPMLDDRKGIQRLIRMEERLIELLDGPQLID